jgi:hypothetical protein
VERQHGKSAADKGGGAWMPLLWIIAASALAHLWCLKSQFFLDDFPQIADSDAVRSGDLAHTGWLFWSYLWFHIQYRWFGTSPIGFHAVNWVLHTGVACALFGFGRDFLRDRWPAGGAFFGALLFAVHPLASEIPNYARSQDLAWVTLFSLLAAWAVLGFLRDGGWWKLAGCVVFILGATFSKGPGLFHALMPVGVVAVAFFQPKHVSLIRKYPWQSAGILLVVLESLWVVGRLDLRLDALHRWTDSRFIGHAYTLSRVFWEFAWRSVIPVGLSADHHIAETLVPPGSPFWNIPDKGSMLAAAGFLAFAAFSVVLAWRKSTRLFGVCLFLYVATILFRVLYFIPEFMPEYRIYPGLPWFCLGAAIGFAAAWRAACGGISPRLPAALLLGVFMLLSAKRSFVWHDLDRLMEDVLERYPTQARALWELNKRDISRENWQAVIDRQRNVWPEVAARFHAENRLLAPERELPTGHFALAEVACAGRYAIALAHQESPAIGLREINRLEIYMKRLGLDPTAHALHWSYFSRDKGLVLELAGNYQAAAECLRVENISGLRKRDLERVEKKLAALKPGS